MYWSLTVALVHGTERRRRDLQHLPTTLTVSADDHWFISASQRRTGPPGQPSSCAAPNSACGLEFQPAVLVRRALTMASISEQI